MCGTACKADEVCNAGACASKCGASSKQCGQSCVDTTNDNANCGACGNACKSGQVCSQSMCSTNCGAGTELCSMVCVDTNHDPANCGGCTKKCAAGRVCVMGTCSSVCGAGEQFCAAGEGGAGYCADVQTDNANCGSCGNECGQGQACSGGKCVNDCGQGQTLCSGDGGAYCANTQTDNANCGSCGNTCGLGLVCQGGTCQVGCAAVDGGVQTLCTPDGGAPYCANTQSDDANCGSCGNACGGGQLCSGGFCSCAQGLSTCGNACVDLKTDVNDCGTCGTVCSGATPNCINGFCSSSTCGDGVVDATEEYDPPPGPFTSVTVDGATCKWHFENVAQLYCNGTCSWAGAAGCDQADANIFCQLKTGNPLSTATTFTTTTALAQPGFPCAPLGYGVDIGELPYRGVNLAFHVRYQDSSILANHGAGVVIDSVTCTNP